jgi:NitT/TauT family transport system substrate-binding protein
VTAPTPLRVCLLPTEKLVPLLVADDDGLFRDAGLDVAIDIVGSAAERDRILLDHGADVALLNLVSIVLLMLEGHALRTLTVIERATSERPMFKLLASPVAHDDGRGRSLGLARGTIVHFVGDAMLAALGARDVTVREASDIPQRAADLMSGRLDLAVLAEPAATECEVEGAICLSDDRVVTAPPPTLCTSAATYATRREDLRRFMEAYARACDIANGDERRARDALRHLGIRHGESWAVPTFFASEMPTAREVATVLDWARRNGIDGAGAADASAMGARMTKP